MVSIEIMFAISFAVVFYTFIGYPLMIWVLAYFWPKPVRRDQVEPTVAVIIVAYNEVDQIERKLHSCLALEYPKDKIRILVASDGSDDGMDECVTKFDASRVGLLSFDKRRGKAACLNDAIASCDEEIIVLTDVRQRLDKGAVRRLVQNFADPEVGAASGALVFEVDGISSFGQGVDAYWRYEKFLRLHESCVHSTVGVTGALYALRRESYCRIPSDTILDDVVIPMNIVVSGLRVVFDEEARAYDSPSQESRQERSRKVRTAAGNYQLLVSHPSFLSIFKNPIFLQFISHKALRLIAPFFLVLLLMTNILVARYSSVYQWLLAGQLIAYGLAVLGIVSANAARFRVVTVARAFLLLNWFAVLGLFEFLRNRATHLWR